MIMKKALAIVSLVLFMGTMVPVSAGSLTTDKPKSAVSAKDSIKCTKTDKKACTGACCKGTGKTAKK
jgi:hypothetical protein